MVIGMLWFDNNSKIDLAAKIHQAAEYYQKKYGRRPNMCFVNPGTLGVDEYKANGIQLRTSRTVMPNHFWLGVNNS